MFVCLGCSWVWAGWGLLPAENLGRLVVLHCGVGWLVVCAWCRRHACCCWLVVVGAPACVGVACCRGSGVVRPGCLACVLLPCVGGGVWVWVGWL